MEENNAKSDWINTLVRRATENLSPAEEILWLQGKFDSFGAKYGMERRQDIDQLIFRKMNGRSPAKDSGLLKIRYWRTGRHKPQSREQCLELGRALELNEQETLYLLQSYYDGADVIFSEDDAENPLYRERLRLFGDLERQYLANAHPDALGWMDIPWDKPQPFLRHYYFQDALNYISGAQQEKTTGHFTSANYVGEFQKSRRLLGEIPRKTILRHLFLMSAPFLSADVMNRRLTALGYATLSQGHESRWGERVDALLLGLLELYAAECTGNSPEQCLLWLQSTCRALDGQLAAAGHPELRFLYFKALKNPLDKKQ